MKKLFLLSITIIAFTLSANSQEIAENAIGLRLGDSDGFGAEISYQRALSDYNRLEFGFGWSDKTSYSAMRLVGLYQWVWSLDGNFNWYAGAGGGIGLQDWDVKIPGQENYKDNETYIFVAGDIGIEYNFDIPLVLSLDFRPEIGFGDELYDNDDLDFDIALGIRYQF